MLSERKLTMIGIAGFYVFASGVLIFVSDLVNPLEFPWHWAWIFWGGLFAPPVVLIMLAAAMAIPLSNGRRILFAGCLLAVLATMQVSAILDLWIGPIVLVVIVLTFSIYLSVRWAWR